MSDLSESERIAIASEFILDAPPGEFNEVFNDVRVLLADDELLKDGGAPAFAKYNRDQFFPVELPNGGKTLITAHGELDHNTYYDPKTKKAFEFDHLRKEVSNMHENDGIDQEAEPWRVAIEAAVEKYVNDHYPVGTCAVYGKAETGVMKVIACIESHMYSPSNFWYAKKDKHTFEAERISLDSTRKLLDSWCGRGHLFAVIHSLYPEYKGMDAGGPNGSWILLGTMPTLQIVVHYFEDGNVQLSTSKTFEHSTTAASETALAAEIVKCMEKEQNAYQSAINESYATLVCHKGNGWRKWHTTVDIIGKTEVKSRLHRSGYLQSEETFKAMRRALPITKTKVDWDKISSYKVADAMQK